MNSASTASTQSKPSRDDGWRSRLPETASTKEGVEYGPRETVWRLYDTGKEITLNFDRYESICSEMFMYSLARYMIELLRLQALDSCKNFYERFLCLLQHSSLRRNGAPVDSVTAEDVASYRGILNKKKEHLLHSMRKRLRVWVQLRYEGVDPAASAYLDALKLKKNESGVAVLNHDPIKGPFDEDEYQSLIQYLLDTFALGIIDLSDLALGFLFIAFGPRPVSYAAMLVKDLEVHKDRHGIDRYTLKIPAAKRRAGGRRTHFLERTLTSEYGQMLQLLVTQKLSSPSRSQRGSSWARYLSSRAAAVKKGISPPPPISSAR